MSGGANGGRANGTSTKEPVVGYLERVTIENVRSIASLVWEVKPEPGWNVILGDNGAGKSTFLRATAIALLTSKTDWLRLNPKSWRRAQPAHLSGRRGRHRVPLPHLGTDDEGGMVTNGDLDRLLYGDLSDAYGTCAMGVVGRSDKAQGLLERLGALNVKSIYGELTDEERKEQRRLRGIFGAGPAPEPRT